MFGSLFPAHAARIRVNNTTANKTMDLFIYFLCSNTPQGKLQIFDVNFFLNTSPEDNPN
jgi:hypothetical protein